MSKSDVDIHQFVIQDYESLGFPELRSESLRLFRDSVVRPSLQALAREIAVHARSNDPASLFHFDQLADLFQATVESYLLSVQAMWERGLRSLLVKRENRLNNGVKVKAVQRALWSGEDNSIQSHFERLVGVPMTVFDSYDDLDLLQYVGNAVRHGDGRSAEQVHKKAPSLWFNWLPPGFILNTGPLKIKIPDNAPKHPSFDAVTLEEAMLEQMIASVDGFWQDLEYLRRNSFQTKDESTVRMLRAWPEERRRRQNGRVWNLEKARLS